MVATAYHTWRRVLDPGAQRLHAILLGDRLDPEEPVDLRADDVMIAHPHHAPVHDQAELGGILDRATEHGDRLEGAGHRGIDGEVPIAGALHEAGVRLERQTG
ncbi:hypothetical protein ACMHYB_02580 [Sorangium sp. So ce1128]